MSATEGSEGEGESPSLSATEGSEGGESPSLSATEGSEGGESPSLSATEGSEGGESPSLSATEGSEGGEDPTLSATDEVRDKLSFLKEYILVAVSERNGISYKRKTTPDFINNSEAVKGHQPHAFFKLSLKHTICYILICTNFKKCGQSITFHDDRHFKRNKWRP